MVSRDDPPSMAPFGALAPAQRQQMLELGPRWNDDIVAHFNSGEEYPGREILAFMASVPR